VDAYGARPRCRSDIVYRRAVPVVAGVDSQTHSQSPIDFSRGSLAGIRSPGDRMNENDVHTPHILSSSFPHFAHCSWLVPRRRTIFAFSSTSTVGGVSGGSSELSCCSGTRSSPEVADRFTRPVHSVVLSLADAQAGGRLGRVISDPCLAYLALPSESAVSADDRLALALGRPQVWPTPRQGVGGHG